MRADLHLHSVYSDGVHTPDEICRRARQNGLQLLSITDHDTMLGLEDKRACAKKYGLAYVAGWEISAYEKGVQVHVLGYGCAMNAAYEKFIAERIVAAKARAEERVEKLRAVGIPVTMEEVLAERKNPAAPLHTMHVGRAAAKRTGLPEDEVYKRYLAWGMPASSDIGRPTPEEAVDCIHALGGVAVLAHPGRITVPEEARIRLIERLTAYGADGIEAVYSTHTAEETAFFLDFAKRNGLLVTGGSDTHRFGGEREIGEPEFYASEALLARLAEKID